MYSFRERIILSNVDLIESMVEIKTVKRTMQDHSALQNFAVTQLPICAVVGGLPVPKEHKFNGNGEVDTIVSDLKVDFYFYLQANENIDQIISSLLNIVWKKLYSNPSRDGLVFSTILNVTDEYAVWSPFAAFKVTVVHQYQHSNEGI